MNWYYVENGAQAGPISETDLEALKQSGRIQHDTLVWREGLSEWQPYHQAVPFSASTGLPPISAVALPDGGRIDLQPMGVGDILDRTFRLYRANFLRFFLVMLAVGAILYLFGLPWQLAMQPQLRGRHFPDPNLNSALMPVALFAWMLLYVVIGLILNQIAIGTLTVAISSAFLGQPVNMGSAFKTVRGRLGSLLGATVLVSFLVGLGLLACIIPGVWLALSWLLVSEVVVLEGLKPWAALRRSRELMRVKTDKGFVHHNITKASVILLITLILGVVAGGIVSIPFVIVAVIQQVAHHTPTFFGPVQIAQGLLTIVVQAAVAPIGRVAMILFYYDIRIRKEGFDLEVLAAAMRGSQRPS